ncbi:hypothetical protein [Lake Baikal phage Baikal-20-5m-C28]|nr:hypothetical protein [Lake Baikal phage Baikal-20-5m-C28]
MTQIYEVPFIIDPLVVLSKNTKDLLLRTTSGTNAEIIKDWKFDTAGNLTLPLGGTILNSVGGSIFPVVSATAPVAPEAHPGTIWFNTNDGKLYVYYDDGNSLQWVQPMSPSVGGSGGGGGSGSGTVSVGLGGRLAYYAANGTTVDNLAEVYWHTHDGTSMLHIDGSLQVSGQKNYVRHHWSTLSSLNTEAPPTTWHGMIAHVHETGRVYFAHAGAWQPLANLSDTANSLATLTDVNVLGATDGQVLKYNISQNKWIAASDLQSGGTGGGISLTDLSVSIATASGAGSLSYNNTGVFTFTPAALGITSILNGGTGTATPSLVAGTNVTISGTWPNQTINSANNSNSFSTLAVAGQTSVVADSPADTLTLVAGSNITITTNATTDTITISSAGAAGGTGVTSVSGTGTVNGLTLTGTITSSGNLTLGGTLSNINLGTAVTSILPVIHGGSGTATPSLVAGTNVTISGTWPNQTVNSSGSGGASTFAALTDATTTALTVDEIYLPAITRLNVTNNAENSFSFDQYSATNPTIYAINATTIAFNLNISGHPFVIQTSGGADYNTGLIHVSTTGTVLTGIYAQGQTSGTLYWKIPNTISGNYKYRCSLHPGMTGIITIKDFAII